MKTINIPVSNLLCSGCGQEIEKKLIASPGVDDVSVSFINKQVTVSFDDKETSEEVIKTVIRGCGYNPTGSTFQERTEQMHKQSGGHAELAKDELAEMSWWKRFKMNMAMTMDMDHSGSDAGMLQSMEDSIKLRFYFALILSIPIILYSPLGTRVLNLQLPSPIPEGWLLFILTTPVIFYSGFIFIYGSYRALKNRTLNMSVLVATGIVAAYFFSVILTILGADDSYYEAAAMLTTFVLFGHWMEMKSRRGTNESLRALFELVPSMTRVERDGQELEIPSKEVVLDDIIVIKPGDKIPVDGEVVTGETAIDESLVTGESMPVEKKPGAAVIGGSVNQSGSIKFKATKVGNDTALAQIVKLVETAQNTKAPGQRLADRAAQYLVIVAVSAGLLTFGVWFFFLGQPFLFALTFAISAVVIACPDALGLATPTAVAVGTGLGAKHNILIKNAATLESVSKIQAVVLDKTGTLTEGKPKVTDVIVRPPFTEDEIIRLDSAAESLSGHPLSLALLNEAKKRKIDIPRDVKEFSAIAGHGVEARVERKHILVGTKKLMKVRNVDTTALDPEIERLFSEGKTLMLVAIEGEIAGVVAAEDSVKQTAQKAMSLFKDLGIEVAMITGDNKQTAMTVANQLGIERVFAEVLPEEKANYVKKLQDEGKFVAMVGDGINDAPALAQADVGIAIGAGTDVAIETADVVLMRSEPSDVISAIRLSKATVRKMKQNLVWASVYNVLAIPIAAGALYPSLGITLRPEFAALLMSASSIIVATNAVMLKRAEKELVT